MNKKELYKILVSLIRYEFCGIAPEDSIKKELTSNVVSALYKLSKGLDFAHVVYGALKKLDVSIDEEIENKFKKAQNLAVYRYTLVNYEQPKISQILKDKNIPFVLLKGAVIRNLYPKSIIRTSCDIDVLVKDENLLSAKSVFEENGYTTEWTNSHDVPFFSQSGAKIELHFKITEEGLNKANVLLNRAWDYTVSDENQNIIFTKQFFLFHHFTHMNFHFLNGGCGIKPIVDLYVIEKEMGVSAEDIKDLLEEACIYKFALEMSDLSRAIFDDTLTDFHYTLLSYLIDGGAYGRIDNKVAFGKTKSGGTLGYLLKRFFLPYNEMKNCYPILKKLPFLLPVFWIVRIFHRLFSKDRAKFAAELNQSTSVSKDKLEQTKQIKERLGL